MFFIPHGALRLNQNGQQQFDARTYQWVSLPSDNALLRQHIQKEATLTEEWVENLCLPNGVFKCNRCYRKHYLVDNFDFLCDGCATILKELHVYGSRFAFTEDFNNWYANVPHDQISKRVALRERLDAVYKAENILYQGARVIVVRDPLKNNGNLEFIRENDDKNRFIVNVFDVQIT